MAKQRPTKERKPVTKLWNKSFILLWEGMLVSALGDLIYYVTLGFWILEKTGSTTYMGMLMGAGALTSLLLTPVAGVLADRVPRKRMIVGTDAVRGVVVCLVGIAALLGHLSPWMLLVAGIVTKGSDAFDAPAVNAALPDMVPPVKLTSGYSALNAGRAVVNAVGNPLAGSLLTFLGAPLMFLINGITYLLCAVTEMFISIPPIKRRKPRAEGSAQAEGVSQARSLSQTKGVSLAEDISQTKGVSLAEDISRAEGVSLAENISQAEGVSLAENISQAEDVSLAEDISRAEGVSLAENIPHAKDIPQAEDISQAEDTSQVKGGSSAHGASPASDAPQPGHGLEGRVAAALKEMLLDIRQAARFILHLRGLGTIMLSALVCTFFGNMAFTLMIPFFQHTQGGGPNAYGFAMAALSVGAGAGFLITMFVNIPFRIRGRLVILCGTVAAGLYALFPFAPFYAMLPMLFVGGFGFTLLSVFCNVALQQATPPELRGKISASINATTNGLSPLAMLVGGLLGDYVPIPYVFLVGMGMVALIILSMSGNRNARRVLSFDPMKQTVDSLMDGGIYR